MKNKIRVFEREWKYIRLTTLLVPLMLYESRSFFPGLVFAMRKIDFFLFFFCFYSAREFEGNVFNLFVWLQGLRGFCAKIERQCSEHRETLDSADCRERNRGRRRGRKWGFCWEARMNSKHDTSASTMVQSKVMHCMTIFNVWTLFRLHFISL